MSKKLLSLLLALIMMLSLTACFGAEEDDDYEVDDDLKGQITSTEKDSEEEKETEEVNKPTLGLGDTKTDKWENAALGLGFALPEGWSFSSKEELDEANKGTLDMLGDSELTEAIKDAQLYYDMKAIDQNGNNISVLFEKMSVPMTEENYAKASISSNKAVFEQLGATNAKVEEKTFTVGTKTFKGLLSTYTYQNIDFECAQLLVSVETHMAVVSITALTEDVEDIIGNLYIVK